MFTESAGIYDLIYRQFKDYTAEAERIARLLRRSAPRARTVLDVACGTGEHARLLHEQHGYQVDGVDIEHAFLAIAQAKVPSGSFWHADMTAFSLRRRYDVVLCLFSSIGYVRTRENVTRTLQNFRRHLAEGGVVIVEPWFTPEAYEPGRIYTKVAELPELSVCRMSHSEVEGRLSRLTFEYLLGRPGIGMERAREVHELGLFSVEEMLQSFRAAKLEAEYDPEGLYGRGLYVARSAA